MTSIRRRASAIIMASKILTKFKYLFNLPFNSAETLLTQSESLVKNQNVLYRTISASKKENLISNFLKTNRKKSVFLATFGGLGLYLLYQYKIKGGIILQVNAESDIPQNPGSLRKRFNFISDIVKKSANAVVCIETFQTSWFQHGVSSAGSGFIIKEDGLVLTNAHVVAHNLQNAVQVRLTDGRTFQGYVEDYDPSADIATIRINAKNLPTLKLGNSSDIETGEWVVAIGSPLSLTNSVTAGVVSSPNRQGRELGVHNPNLHYIQTDAAITFGNSGGPLVNLDGEVIGINAMKVTPGISFALPIDYAKDFLNRSEEKRRLSKSMPKKGYLGTALLTLTPELVTDLMRSNYLPQSISSGVFVWKVTMGSPAQSGGLKPGDIIVSLDDKPVKEVSDIYGTLRPKKEILLRIFREGHFYNVKILPEEGM